MSCVFNQTRLSIKEIVKSKRIRPATVCRWALSGVRGRRLKTIRIGGRRFVLRNDPDHPLKQSDRLEDQTDFWEPDQKRQKIAKTKLDLELGKT